MKTAFYKNTVSDAQEGQIIRARFDGRYYRVGRTTDDGRGVQVECVGYHCSKGWPVFYDTPDSGWLHGQTDCDICDGLHV